MSAVELLEGVDTNLMFQLAKADDGVQERMGISARRFGRGIAVSVRDDPSRLWSKAQGFGYDGPITKELIGEVIEFFQSAGTAVATFHLPAEVLPDNWDEIAEVHRLVEQRPVMLRLVRDAVPVAPAPSTLEIRKIRPHERTAWAAVQAAVLEVLDEQGRFTEMLGSLSNLPDLVAYGAFARDQLVATAAMYVEGEVAHFLRAATLPSHRGRGAHSALVAARARDALAAGCRWMSVETVSHAPGHRNPSLDNLQRARFHVAYERRRWLWDA